MRKAFALASTLILLGPPLRATPPYRSVATTPLPAMPEGDFDQLVADVPHDHLYLSAEDGAAMDVFRLSDGALVQSGGAVGSPHKVALDSRTGHLLVADGKDGSVKVMTADLAPVATIAVGPKPDTGVLDADSRLFYVSSRDETGAASLVSAISLDDPKVVRSFPVPATTLKGMILDRPGHRLLVGMRERNSIAVIDLNTGATAIWAPAGLHLNVPMAIDARHHRLFVGSRKPGKLSVLNARDGWQLQELPSTETSDSMSFDPSHCILYVSGDTGMSRYRVWKDGRVSLLETDPALDGKTSLLVPELHRLYVMRRKSAAAPAALTVFDVTGDRAR